MSNSITTEFTDLYETAFSLYSAAVSINVMTNPTVATNLNTILTQLNADISSIAVFLRELLDEDVEDSGFRKYPVFGYWTVLGICIVLVIVLGITFCISVN